MAYVHDYFRGIQKFTTSHYWNSGVRITAGVLIPMLIMIYFDWLSFGIPFLLAALFIGIIDTPGPIHHRINGMLVAIGLNTLVVLVTGMVRENSHLLVFEVAILSFVFSMIGVYGARAASIGTLALIMMLLNMSTDSRFSDVFLNTILVVTGGLWYFVFSVLLNRLQPYRIVEQALGEYVTQIASYLQARGSLYKHDFELNNAYNRVMQEQVSVVATQGQVRELLFKTRQLVQDASPKSRSLMMMYLEASDLLEETMYSYHDYDGLRTQVTDTKVLGELHKLIFQVVAEIEYVGLRIQAGAAVRRPANYDSAIAIINDSLAQKISNSKNDEELKALVSIQQIIANIKSIIERINRIIEYTQMKSVKQDQIIGLDEKEKTTNSDFGFSLFLNNLNYQSNHFRFALRISFAMLIGYAVASLLELSHAYWILLTIVTILKPAYNLARKRNMQRVGGTLLGLLLAACVFFLTENSFVLVSLLILSMLLAYSFLRINYLGFVTFLTFYIIISFYFLNPDHFRELMGERLIDTLIGSMIAAFATRFIFPAWQHENITSVMDKSLAAQIEYLEATEQRIKGSGEAKIYDIARNHAIIALTNLSDSFQQMLAEPANISESTLVHQFVITNHSLTSRISSLDSDVAVQVRYEGLHHAIALLKKTREHLNNDGSSKDQIAEGGPSVNKSTDAIVALARELLSIVKRMQYST